MVRRLTLVCLACLIGLSLACSKGPKKSGPVIAKGNGFTITADELKARLDEQSPFIRARYNTLERKREFLDNMIRLELLATEAEKQKLDKDPEVLAAVRKVMVQKLVQRNFQDSGEPKDIPDADVQKYYDAHKDEFIRPKRIGVAQIFFKADAGTPDRAKKLSKARTVLAKLREEDKKNAMAFGTAARELSEDEASKIRGGDVGFKSQEELTKAYTPEIAEKLFSMKSGELADLVELPAGVYVFKVQTVQEGSTTTLEMAKRQIALRLNREKKTKEFDEWVKKLRADAVVSVDDGELDKVAVAAAPTGPNLPHAGMPGMPGPGAPHPTLAAPGAAPGTTAVPPRPVVLPNAAPTAPAPTAAAKPK
jgi:peptidyl-prolyl cis-trans isomerase C